MMERYRKANEGIHAPDELKRKAARPQPRHSRAKWIGGLAAVLALVILAGVVFHSGLFPTAYASAALATAQYPEMAPYPSQDDYDHLGGLIWDADGYVKARDAYEASINALTSGTDYTGRLDRYLTASAKEFLAGTGEDNRVYSPLNIYMALAMLAETTGGESRQQLLDLLGAGSIEELRILANALWRDNYRDDGQTASIMANSLWLSEDLGDSYVQDTLDTLARDYYASSFSGEMGSEAYNQALRDWLNEQTHGLLKDAADGLEMDPNTVLGLASTVYFKAEWANKFEPENTRQDTFHASSGDITVDFMHSSHGQDYYWGAHFSAVSLSFEGSGSEMWLILPDEGYSPDDLLTTGEALEFLLTDKTRVYDGDRENWTSDWIDQKDLTVHLSLPKFDVSSSMDLIEGLQNLGVTDVFDHTVSDFTPLTDLPDIFVSRVTHAARVIADEEKVEAAAFTFMDTIAAAAPVDEDVDFVLDRPFIFAITGPSGLPLFVGVVNNP